MRFRKTIGSSLFLLLLVTVTTSAFAQIGIGISVGFGPPALPVYEQPLCPGDGYLWTPGYWAWDNDGDDYYWVPGTWVMAPEVGYLWTPPWWGWEGNAFFFHEGYWGPQIGFYGGINYGFGYFGEGYAGGRWQDGRFFYNREVNNINVTNIRNVYNERVTINNENHVSYNGHGGVEARPSPRQEEAMRERHIGPVSAQTQHIQEARGDRSLRANENHGKPPIAATARPGALREGAVPARAAGGNYEPPPNRGGNRGAATGAREVARPPDAAGSRGGNSYAHARDLPPMDRPAAPNTGDAKRDRKYQQQQEKMMSQQNKEREKLQAQQEKDHQRMEKQQANDQRKQQMEQRHQQQTQQLSQRHQQQQEKMQTRVAPSHSAPAAPPREGNTKPH